MPLRCLDEQATPLGMTRYMLRVGQNHIYTPDVTVHLGISLPELLYINRVCMVLAKPIYVEESF